MKKKTVYETNVEEIRDYDWLSCGDVLITDDEEAKEAAKVWKVSPEMVMEIKKALDFMATTICDAVIADLTDIYKKVE